MNPLTLLLLPLLAAGLIAAWVLAMDLLIRTWEGTPALSPWWFRQHPLMRCLLALLWPLTVVPLAIAWSLEPRR